MLHVFERDVAGKTLRIETGKVALQANGAVIVRYGDTVVLVTAVASVAPREGIDFFPLTVDYEERLYAAGKIPGSFFRREGRPTTEGILTMRLVDRPLRPMFPKGMRNDVQIIITTLSADQENPPDILGIIGASAALSISDIPFETISGTRIGYMDGRLIVNPTLRQAQDGALDLTVAGTKEGVVMVEAGSKEVSEELMLQAMKMAQIINSEIIDLINEMKRTVGKPKFALPATELPSAELTDAVNVTVGEKILQALRRPGIKADREEAFASIKADTLGKLAGQFPDDKIAVAYEAKLKETVRQSILKEGLRPDGRKLDEIRPITCEVGVLPRTHGSGLFTRGETQALTIATLGSMGEKQKIDGIGIEETKRYIHHYNFPPFSTGEVRRVGSSGRREIGHGALAERALEPVIPSEEEFPYVLRLVSEILGSNGSSSMASVCGSTLALMDAGVPIKKPVAGVAMGLVKGEGKEFAVLTDIQGLEDALGDIDFKVAGTADGITALQMDMKAQGISIEVLTKALEQAKHGRMFVLGKLTETIAQARPELSKYAPRMIRIKINPEKIGAVIGPGGKMIRSIIEQTKASVDVEDDGTVFIGATSEEAAQRAIKMIEGLTKDVEVGEVYTGKVTRTMNFGAFVEILPGKEGLVHISELSDQRVNSVDDVVKIGDELMVMVTEIDRMGRINLSRRAVLEGLEQGGARVRDTAAEGESRNGGSGDGPRSFDRGGRPPFRGDRGPGGPPRRDSRPPFRGDRGPGGPPRHSGPPRP